MWEVRVTKWLIDVETRGAVVRWFRTITLDVARSQYSEY